MTRTAESLGIRFTILAPPEEVTIRRGEEYLGKLIRSTPGGPVWADPKLQEHTGPVTTETMEEARGRVLTLLAGDEA